MATFERRKTQTGRETIRVKIRCRGLRRPLSETFPNMTLAKKWATQTEAEIRAGRFLKTIEARRHTVGEAIDRYIRDVLPHKSKAMQTQARQLEEWRKEIGHLTLDQVSPQIIAECRDKFRLALTQSKAPRKPSTVNRFLSAFSHLLNIAVLEWEWMEDSPMRKVKKLKEPRGRVRSLTDAERERLLAVCDESECRVLGLIVRIGLSTGMRRSEITSLRWPDIDLKDGKTIIHHTKNGERRGTYITGRTLELLRAHSKVKHLQSDFVFPSPLDSSKPLNFQTAWRRALERSEIQDLRFHDLRHEFATRIAEEGASLAQLSEALGHKTLSMVKRYSHLTESSIVDVVTQMNRRIFG